VEAVSLAHGIVAMKQYLTLGGTGKKRQLERQLRLATSRRSQNRHLFLGLDGEAALTGVF
jgi:hypothetical protein